MVNTPRVRLRDWAAPLCIPTSGRLPDGWLPEPDETVIWTGIVPASEEDRAAALGILTGEERERAAAFLVERARWSFVGARAMLRTLLAGATGVAPSAVVLGREGRGKPFLEYPRATDLRFNVSHSRDLMAVALAQARSVGVDVEWMDRELEWESVASRVLCEAEKRRLRSLPSESQREEFLACWTCKEAFVKATGAGMAVDLASVEVLLGPAGAARYLALPNAERPEHWQLARFACGAGYAGAVAYEASPSARIATQA